VAMRVSTNTTTLHTRKRFTE